MTRLSKPPTLVYGLVALIAGGLAIAALLWTPDSPPRGVGDWLVPVNIAGGTFAALVWATSAVVSALDRDGRRWGSALAAGGAALVAFYWTTVYVGILVGGIDAARAGPVYFRPTVALAEVLPALLQLTQLLRKATPCPACGYLSGPVPATVAIPEEALATGEIEALLDQRRRRKARE